MRELNYSSVVFHDSTHSYVNTDGVILSGVTSILKRNLFQDKYTDVPPEILRKAAEKGSYIHEQCQNYDEFGVADDCLELQNYNRIKQENNITPLANEYLITDNERYATMIDMVDTSYNLYDFKTTSKIDEEYLMWQLSINAHLFELQNPHIRVGRLFGIWLRGEESKLIELKRIPNDVVTELLRCDSQGIEFTNEITAIATAKNEIDQLFEIEELIISIKTKAEEAEKNKERLSAIILKNMIENNQKSIETATMKITRVAPSVRITLDTKKLKEENKELYNKYKKESSIKESVKITIKKS